MTQVVLPYRPVAGDPEDVAQVMADFDSILNVVNGDLRDDNISPSAAIAVSKLAPIPGSKLEIHRGTVPPTSPADGDLWQFVPAGGIETWQLCWDAGGARWNFIGGGGLFSEKVGVETVTSSGYTLAHSPPAITIPLNGTYDLTMTITAHYYGAAGNGGIFNADMWGTPPNGLLTDYNAGGIQLVSAGITNTGVGATMASTRRLALTKNQAIQIAVKTASQQAALLYRSLSIRPVGNLSP